MGEGDGGFRAVGEGEEGFRGAEHVLDFWEGDAVVDEPEESVCFGGVDELGGDFFNASVEVVKGDFGDRAFRVFGGCHFEGLDGKM